MGDAVTISNTWSGQNISDVNFNLFNNLWAVGFNFVGVGSAGLSDEAFEQADDYFAIGQKAEALKDYNKIIPSESFDDWFEDNKAQYCPSCKTGSGTGAGLGAAKDILSYAGYAGSAADYARYEMLVARTSRDLLSNVGRSGNLKTIYWFGQAGKWLGRAGNAGGVLSVAIDANSVSNGTLSVPRLSYNTTGVLGSIVVGATVGSLPGAVVGLGFTAGQMAYDGIMWFGDQLSQALNQAENALNSGTWIPGH